MQFGLSSILMRTLLSIFASGAAVYAGLCAWLYATQRSQIYFRTPATDHPGAEPLWLESEGERIKVWSVLRDGPRALIYFGGNAEDVAGNIDWFWSMFPGHSLYLVNYRGYGGSSGQPSETALRADALAARELEHVVRTAQAPSADTDLAQLTARARTPAGDHDVWPAHFALGATERRRERWAEAREALEAAVLQSPGATPAHLELVAVHVALGSAEKALEHADRACALEGETARTLAVRATALLAASKHADARATIDRALALDASEANRAIEERIRKSSEPPSAFARLRMALGLGKKR